MELLIAQATKQFEQILSPVQDEAQSKQLNEVEKGIFYSLLKLGLTLLFRTCSITAYGSYLG